MGIKRRTTVVASCDACGRQTAPQDLIAVSPVFISRVTKGGNLSSLLVDTDLDYICSLKCLCNLLAVALTKAGYCDRK